MGDYCKRMRLAGILIATLVYAALITPAAALDASDLPRLNGQIDQLMEYKKYAAALPLARRVVELAETELGPESAETVIALTKLVDLLKRMGRSREALPLAKRSVAVLHKQYGQGHDVAALAEHNLAIQFLDLGEPAEAEGAARRAIAVFQKSNKPNMDNIAAAHNTLAIALHRLNRPEEAEPAARHAVELWEQLHGPDSPATANGLRTWAITLNELDRYGEAERTARRLIALSEKLNGATSIAFASDLAQLASILQRQGRAAEAEPTARRALALIEGSSEEKNDATANAINTLCSILISMSKFDEAEPLARRLVDIWENEHGADSYAAANARTRLATALNGRGESQASIEQATRAMEIWSRIDGPRSLAVALAANNLGYKHLAQNDHVAAEAAFRQALNILDDLKLDGAASATALSGIAESAFARSNWTHAADWYGQYLDKFNARANRSRSAPAANQSGAVSSQMAQAGPHLTRFIKASYRSLSETLPVGDEMSHAFAAAQSADASAAAASIAGSVARNAKNPALAALIRERQKLASEWQSLEMVRITALSKTPNAPLAKEAAAGASRAQAIDKRIAAIDASLDGKFPAYTALANPTPLSISQTQALLGEREALIYLIETPHMTPTPEETFIWVITKTRSRWVKSDLGSTALAEKVAALRCGLDATAWTGDGTQRCSNLLAATPVPSGTGVLAFDPSIAHDVYKALFGQIEDLLDDKHLLIVPTGSLTQLPFHTLITLAPHSRAATVENWRTVAWLVRRNAISILPAVSSLKALRTGARASRAVSPYFGIGNPLLDGLDGSFAPLARAARERQQCATMASWPHVPKALQLRGGAKSLPRSAGIANVSEVRAQPPLPETAEELCTVARFITARASDLRLGAEATEESVKSLNAKGQLARYRIVHFATHGALAGAWPGGSAADTEPGLLLTPPPFGTLNDDGYLSASEIAGLKLDADLVILSAPSTAGGDAKEAEALSGLASAFFYSGARALLVAHWPVEPAATIKLITEAVTELQHNPKGGRAEAVRRAMLAMINQGGVEQAHPSAWAAFDVMGDGLGKPSAIPYVTGANPAPVKPDQQPAASWSATAKGTEKAAEKPAATDWNAQVQP